MADLSSDRLDRAREVRMNLMLSEDHRPCCPEDSTAEPLPRQAESTARRHGPQRWTLGIEEFPGPVGTSLRCSDGHPKRLSALARARTLQRPAPHRLELVPPATPDGPTLCGDRRPTLVRSAKQGFGPDLAPSGVQRSLSGKRKRPRRAA